MKTTATYAFLFLLFLAAPVESAVTFDWATVGNPGNPDHDTINAPPRGGVNYTFLISKYEVTNVQYTEFLNAVDSEGNHAVDSEGNPLTEPGASSRLYNPRMSSYEVGGINFDIDAANGAKYEVKPGHEQYPVVLVPFLKICV